MGWSSDHIPRRLSNHAPFEGEQPELAKEAKNDVDSRFAQYEANEYAMPDP
jgi:hypothetical protein